jgi:hypothetical protein
MDFPNIGQCSWSKQNGMVMCMWWFSPMLLRCTRNISGWFQLGHELTTMALGPIETKRPDEYPRIWSPQIFESMNLLSGSKKAEMDVLMWPSYHCLANDGASVNCNGLWGYWAMLLLESSRTSTARSHLNP